MIKNKLDFLSRKKKIIVVMAHPDDEIIFANSILRKASKIIICFQNIPGEKLISKGRYLSSLNYPMDTLCQLGITQSKYSRKIINWSQPKEIKYGLRGYLNYKDYKENYYLIYEKLSKELTSDVLVVTHNPWGEYGHPEHIQVNRVISELAFSINFELYVTGFVSTSTLKYSKSHYSNLSKNFIKYKSDLQIYDEVRKLYEKYQCWTWFSEFVQNEYEIFYKQINNTYDANSFKQNVYIINQIPLYIINDGSNISRNFFHIIKSFLPRFAKKIFRDIKFKNE